LDISIGVTTHEIVKLNGGNTAIDTRNDLLGDGNRIDMLGVKAVTQP
jgi:rhamnose utilization protein RhaD (predicted bifunctional aldolase and dehydrogenase)